MTTNTTTGATTSARGFQNCTVNGDHLFTVSAGIPLSDGFNALSMYQSSAQSVLESMATGGGDAEDMKAGLWAAVHLLELCHAVTQALHGGHNAHLATMREGA